MTGACSSVFLRLEDALAVDDMCRKNPCTFPFDLPHSGKSPVIKNGDFAAFYGDS